MRFLHAPRTSKKMSRRLRHRAYRFWRSVVVLHDTPHRIAWGFALGMFIGWLPIVGIQMVVVAVVAWALRGNVLASLPPVWISNPLTLVPMYYIMNRVGAVFVGNELKREHIADIVDQVLDMGWLDAAHYLMTEVLGAFGAMMVGGAILGLACAVPSYFLVRRAAYGYQVLRANRREDWRTRREPAAPASVEEDGERVQDVHPPAGQGEHR